jgi:hypothetical protein
MAHQADGSCEWYSVQRDVLRGSAPPHAVRAISVSPSSPLSAHPFRPVPVRGLGASRLCSTLWYIASVPMAPERTTDPVRPLPIFAYVRCSIGYVADPCSHVRLSGDAQHLAHAEPPHTTYVIMGDVAERLSLLDPLEYGGSPCRRRDLEAEN